MASEYSTLRSIARKRLERLESAGYAPKIHIPTVKEIKASGASIEKATASLKEFLSSGQTVKQARIDQALNGGFEFKFNKHDFQKQPRKPMTERQKEKRRQRERINRMMAGAWGKGEEMLRLARGLRTMGMSVPASQLPAFADYVEMRFSQGTNIGKYYKYKQYAEDFVTLLKKGYTPDKMMKDFNQYRADQAFLRSEAKNFKGMSYADSQDMFSDWMDTL